MAALDLLWLSVNCCGPAVAVYILSAAVDLQWQSPFCQMPWACCGSLSAAEGTLRPSVSGHWAGIEEGVAA